MKVLEYMLSLMVVVLLIGSLYILIEINKKSSNFYELENSKINLAMVKHLRIKVDYSVTLAEHSTYLNPQEIQNIENILLKASSNEFYAIHIKSYFMFDDEKVILFDSKKYLKKPSIYRVSKNMLEKLKIYGLDDAQYNNLLLLKDKDFRNKEEFISTVIEHAKLTRDNWTQENIPLLGMNKFALALLETLDESATEMILKEEDITEILKSLNNAYKQYLGVSTRAKFDY